MRCVYVAGVPARTLICPQLASTIRQTPGWWRMAVAVARCSRAVPAVVESSGVSSRNWKISLTVIRMLVRSHDERCDQRVIASICRKCRPAHEQGRLCDFRGPTTVKEVL